MDTASTTPDSANHDSGTIRVLVADDEETVVDVLRTLVGSDPTLRFIGAAGDAEQAIELVLRDQPDVVLLDVRMPGGGGPHAAREISKRSPQTKIVALSAHDDPDTVIGMIGAGAHDYVPKGDSTDKILRTIHRTARGERPADGTAPHLTLVRPTVPRRDDVRPRWRAPSWEALSRPSSSPSSTSSNSLPEWSSRIVSVLEIGQVGSLSLVNGHCLICRAAETNC